MYKYWEMKYKLKYTHILHVHLFEVNKYKHHFIVSKRAAINNYVFSNLYQLPYLDNLQESI